MEGLAQTLLTGVVSALTAFPLGMLLERRKRSAEAKGTELENVEKGLELYRKMLADANEMIEMLQRRERDLSAQLKELKAENQKLKGKE